MSEELDFTSEVFLKELRRMVKICEAAERFCEYAIGKMNTDELGLATEDTETAIRFLELLKDLVQELSGDDDGTIDFEYEQLDDSASGGGEADSREESGDVRPSIRKFH